MHCFLTHPDPSGGPTGAGCSKPIAGLNPTPPAVVEPRFRKLNFAQYPATPIDGRSPNALEFPTANPAGGTIRKSRPR